MRKTKVDAVFEAALRAKIDSGLDALSVFARAGEKDGVAAEIKVELARLAARLPPKVP